MSKTPSAVLSRRRVLSMMGGVALGGPLLAACTGSGEPSGGTGGSGGSGSASLTWWDHKNGAWIESTFDRFTSDFPDVSIERQFYPAEELAQTLQLGRRSDQLPDVHTAPPNVGLVGALVQGGWFQPFPDGVDVAGTPVESMLIEGIHTFDGKLYSFPVHDGRAHEQSPWVVTDRLPVDIDPADAQTWDGFRDVCRKITGDDVYAIAFAASGPNYLDFKLKQLASSAGATHVDGIDYSTGEYVFDSRPFLDAMEYLLALQSDGVFHPSFGSMLPPDSTQRWAAGEALIHWHGAWVPGGVANEYPELLDMGFDVWRMPTPDGSRTPVHFGPSQGEFWISSVSEHPEQAAEAIAAFASQETFVGMADAMAAPPVDPAAVEAAGEAIDQYKQNLAWLLEECRYAPAPEARNPAVVLVQAEMEEIHPNPAEIVQGALTGTIDDWKAALTGYTSKISAERDRAIDVVAAEGKSVSAEDWVFSNWDPSSDFSADDYA